MNIFDENIIADQRQLLRKWRIPFRQIGREVGHKGMKDADIIPFLLRLRGATLFTVDRHFYRRTLCHAKYGVVFLDVDQTEAARYIRRVLRHPAIDTQVRRLGLVIRASATGLDAWRLRADVQEHFAWME